MTQRERAHDLLRSAAGRGVCITDVGLVNPEDVLTFRNRVSELRREGLAITAERCTVHAHRAPVFRYTLATEPLQEQMAL